MTDLPDRLASALADHYRLEQHIGEGGMASVYLAHDLKHDRKVALKVLKPELAAILGGERFVKEIKVTANLQHPNILPLYDSGAAESFLYYVMPYVEGESLRDKMNREKQLSVEETVSIACDVADALHFAHEQGIVHRDIKPENILLQRGKPLVADFGIALAVSQASGTRLTETGLSLGTPHYMSPEQATGDRELDARSDIYSLGAMVYEMLVGEPPHHGTTVQAIVARILSDDPEPVTKHRQSVPLHIESAIRKSLDKTPADRFGSADKFAEALRNPAFTLPMETGATAAPAEARVPMRGVTVGAVAVAIAAIAIAAWGWLRPIERPVSRYQVLLPADEQIAPTTPPRFSLSDDGSMIAYTGLSSTGQQIWIRRRSELHATPLPGTEGMLRPFFSPDGAHVGFVDASETLFVMALGGGAPIMVVDTGVGNEGVDWAEDGFLYYDGLTAGGDIGLKRIPAFGGAVEQLTTVDTASGESDHNFPNVLPNGNGLLFRIERGMSPSDIAVLDLRSGEYRILVRGAVVRYAASGHIIYVTPDGALVALPFDQGAMEVTGEPVSLAQDVLVASAGVDAGADFTVSTDGTLLYATGDALTAPHDVVRVTRDGTAEVIDPRWSGQFTSLALSPDGDQLAVGVVQAGETQVWVKQLERGPLTKLTFAGSISYRPAWTPDGTSVAFVSNRDGPFNSFIKPANGSAQAELLHAVGTNLYEVEFSGDGQWLLYRFTGGSASGTGRDIAAVHVTGDTTPVPLLNSRFEERGFALSPDGRWLAYVSNESGREEVYVRPFPNVAAARWQVSVDGGTEPLWARSGEELFYVSRGTLKAVRIIRGTAFANADPEDLFRLDGYVRDLQHRAYDIMPDDRHFVMIRLKQGVSTEQLIVVENLFEELKNR
jgi:serine/threonine-protein kinase